MSEIDKKEIIKEIETNSQVMIRYDKKWRYPNLGDEPAKCPMLDFMLKLEYRSGTLIFIPDKKNKFGEPGNAERNSED